MRVDRMEPRELARRARIHSLRMVARARASHIGSCLSMADILAVLYARILRFDVTDPNASGRDRFVLSKGHGAAVLYAVLAESGFFPVEALESYCSDGSDLAGHVSHSVPGVEVSTGSLGHGLPIGAGIALATRDEPSAPRAFVLVGDGELDEGSNWEAMLFAATHGLERLTVIVDRNDLQGFGHVDQVMRLEPLADKFRAFGWSVLEIDGHDPTEIEAALSCGPSAPGRPTAVIARTVKGKGVAFMEDRLEWHYRSPDPAQLAEALAGLGETL
jgi:transketolase